jgi:hypothetical protein
VEVRIRIQVEVRVGVEIRVRVDVLVFCVYNNILSSLKKNLSKKTVRLLVLKCISLVGTTAKNYVDESTLLVLGHNFSRTYYFVIFYTVVILEILSYTLYVVIIL